MTGPKSGTSSKQRNSVAEQNQPHRRYSEYAGPFWEALVKENGKREAKVMMRHLMNDSKPGRPITDDTIAMTICIVGYIVRHGPRYSSRKIARLIFESNPYYLDLESGAVVVANDELTEQYLSLPDDPIVGRRCIEMKFEAIKKRVERIKLQL